MLKHAQIGPTRKCFTSLYLLILLAFWCPLLASAQDEIIDCEELSVLPLNSTFRSDGDIATVRSFKLEIPVPGLLTVEVSVPGFDESEAKINGFSSGCAGRDTSAEDVTQIEQTPTRLVLTTKAPMSYIVQVVAQNPHGALDRYKLRSRFVASEIDEAPTSTPLEGEEEEEEEEGESDDEIELEPFAQPRLPLELWGMETLPLSVERGLCQTDEVDDHAGTFECATGIHAGSEVAGELRNPWADDEDFFFFFLTQPRTIQLRTFGPTDTFGSLYDRAGHRLAADDDGGQGDQLRILKTLSAGIYFVRIEGSQGAEGPYTLIFDVLSW